MLILDDVLATGGTFSAAVRLFERCGVQVAAWASFWNSRKLRGREALGGQHVSSLLRL